MTSKKRTDFKDTKMLFDQADELRLLVQRATPSNAVGFPIPQFVVIGSGKRGVGATSLAVSLAVSFAKGGHRTLLVDGDSSAADATRQCGVEPFTSLRDILDGRRNVHEVLQRGPEGLLVLPGSWNSPATSQHSAEGVPRFLGELAGMARFVDRIVLDTGHRLDEATKQFWSAAGLVALVTTSEPTAIIDTYAALKHLAGAARCVGCIINRESNEIRALETSQRINRAAEKFLNRSVAYFGCLPEDPQIAGAPRATQPFISEYPDGPASRALERIAEMIGGNLPDARSETVGRDVRAGRRAA
jgi:flagellar biosynthesis protein FlhG